MQHTVHISWVYQHQNNKNNYMVNIHNVRHRQILTDIFFQLFVILELAFSAVIYMSYLRNVLIAQHLTGNLLLLTP